MRVAFFGLGNIGGPIADVLIASPHPIAVYDPVAAAMAPRVAAGARGASSPADAVHDADICIVIVRDDAQVLDVLSVGQTLDAMRSGTIVVLHSTVAPETVRIVDTRCAERGLRFIDAGISNGGGRKAGNQILMCGGDPAILEAARPVLGVYCSEMLHFGPVGAGMKAKLIRNAMRYALFATQYEGMALAEAAGLDLSAFADLYRATFGTVADDEMILRRPTQKPAAIGSPIYPAMEAATRLGWKDLHDAEELAREVGCEIPMAVASKALMGPAFGVDVPFGG